MLVTLSLAFTAGLVATVNPCGFAMLPAYLSYSLGTEAGGRDRLSARRGLSTGIVVSSGFIVVFGAAGILLVPGIQTVRVLIPWLALIIGVALVALGIGLIMGGTLSFRVPWVGRSRRGRRSLFLFGVTYAVASLSCTLPVFLSVVVTTFTAQSFLEGLAAFLVYAAGMSLVLMAVSVAVALGKDSLVRKLRSTSRLVGRISGTIMVLAGGFVSFYWAVVLFRGAEDLNQFEVTRAVERASAWATGIIGAHPGLVALGIAFLLAGGLLAGARRSRRVSTDQATEGEEAVGLRS